MMGTRKRFGRKALAVAACALAACLCAGAAFAAGEAGSDRFAVSDVLVEASEQPAAAPVSDGALADADGSDAGDGLDQAGSGLQLSKTAVYNEGADDYTVTLEAYATGSSTTTVVKDGADIVLMLDLSDYMYGTKTETTTTYDYDALDGRTHLRELSTDADVYWFRSGSDYYSVTVTKQQGEGPWEGTRVTVAYNDGSQQRVLIDGASGGNSLGDLTLYTRSSSTTTATVPDETNTAKLDALKIAVNGFIDKVHAEAPASRIAIVTYAGGAVVESGEAVVESGSKPANAGALVTVDATGAEVLKAIVSSLSIQGGASNSHYAAADAVKIFQDVPADSAEYGRQRFALLFSAGVPGTGWETGADKQASTSGQSVAQAAMHLSTILKTAKGSSAALSTGSNVDGGRRWSESDIAGLLGKTNSGTDWKEGCGATFYSVGLDIPTSGDPAKVFMGEEPHKSGALANEYFWRISSDRADGSHITSPLQLGPRGQLVFDNRYQGDNDYTSYYYFYPDELTRNQDSGHYMTTTSGSPEDLAKLDEIFKGIASSVVTGVTTSTTLGASAVVKDVVAPQFTVPANTSDVNLYTADCTGVSSSGALTFEGRGSATGVAATISDSTLNVTGFDFSDNWCGPRTGANGATTYDGKKLIIEFKVKVKDGFLGGNDVYTNASAGVYADGAATEPVQAFEKPTVNVPIKTVTATAPEKNVYLLGSLTAEQIKSGATFTCGGVTLDPSEANYGLKSWQSEYVDIEVTYADASGNVVVDLSGLKDDTTYTVTATVSPKTKTPTSIQGTVVTEQKHSATGNINVFKPELTFEDSEVWYGGDAPTDYSGNNTLKAWKHGTTSDSSVTMVGTVPTLSLTCDPEYGKVSDDGKIASKDDVAVDVKVEIGAADVTDETAFKHADCAGKTCSVPSGKEFLLHVNTCSLTIEKAAASGTAIGGDEYFVFDVKKDGKAYTQAVVRGTGSVTISELPVGAYSVSEDSSTAWRYASSFGKDSATLNKDNASATVVCTNAAENDKWINCFSRVINVFGVKHAAEANE